MANIQKRRDGKWRARYRDAAGKEHARHFARKVDAQQWLTAEESRIQRGEWVAPQDRRVTIGELVARVVDTKRDERNREWYATMARHVLPSWEATPVGAVEHLSVQQWVRDLEAAGTGADTVRGAYRVLHEALTLALRGRLIHFDPADGVTLPKVNRREMLFLSAAQVNELAAALDRTWPGRGWGVLVRFAAYSGCRAGEIGALRVEHLDLLRRRVHIVAARKATGRIAAPKAGSDRWVDLPRQLCGELAVHLNGKSRSDFVWTGDRGGVLDHKWFYRQRFSPVVADLTEQGVLPTATKVEPDGTTATYTLRFHDLRHSCVALLIGQGAQQYEVMEHLGHTRISTTVDTYGHMFPRVRERIREALERTWDEAVEA